LFETDVKEKALAFIVSLQEVCGCFWENRYQTTIALLE